MKDTILSYMAGIIDGEGTVNITLLNRKWGTEYRLRLYVGNTDKRLMDWLFNNFGGYTKKITRKSHWNPNWKDKYEWYLYLSSNSIQLMRDLYPYMVCKKDQVQVALDFLGTYKGTGYKPSEDDKRKRGECKSRLSTLNMKGRRAAETTEREDSETK